MTVPRLSTTRGRPLSSTVDSDFTWSNGVATQVSAPSGLASQDEEAEEETAADEVPTTEMGPPDGEEASEK